MKLSTAVWNILNGKPILNAALRKAAVEAIRNCPDYLKPITVVAEEDYEEKLAPKLEKYAEKYRRSPNQSSAIKPKYIMLHHSVGSFKSAFWWILDPKSDVSYHYLVDTDGSRTQFVWDNKKAWHAGRSYWGGFSGLNSHSIGISVSGDTNKRTPSDAEVDSVARKSVYLIDKFPDMRGRLVEDVVITHKMAAPNRKDDTTDEFRSRVISRIKELQS